MRLATETMDHVVVATVEAEQLNTRNAQELRSGLAQLLMERSFVVLDLSRVESVDSAGLAAILSSLRLATARGGDLKVCCAAKPVRAIFELVRMHRVLDILNSREEALAAFEPVELVA